MTHLLLRSLCVSMVFVAAACGGPSSEPASTTSSTPPAAAAPVAPAPAAPAEAAKDEDGHAHTAPHGGALVELGDHFAFLEWVVDPDAGRITLYVLDGEAEKPIRLAQKAVTVTVTSPAGIGRLDLQGRANTLTGETVGDTSEFVATHAALKGVAKFEARLSEISVKGQALKDLSIVWPDSHD